MMTSVYRYMLLEQWSAKVCQARWSPIYLSGTPFAARAGTETSMSAKHEI